MEVVKMVNLGGDERDGDGDEIWRGRRMEEKRDGQVSGGQRS